MSQKLLQYCHILFFFKYCFLCHTQERRTIKKKWCGEACVVDLIFPQELFLIDRNKTELLELGYQKSGGVADYAHPITTPLIYLPKNGGDETHVLKRSGAPDKWQLWKSSGKSRYVWQGQSKEFWILTFFMKANLNLGRMYRP